MDGDRIAPYASKTELFGSTTEGPSPPEVVFDVTDDAPSAPMVIDVDEPDSSGGEVDLLGPLSKPSQWRSSLSTGSLIDVKTKSGVWQQACICELREVTLVQTRCLDGLPVCAEVSIAQPAADGPAADMSSVETTAIETSSDEDIDDMVVQVSESTASPVSSPAITPVLVAEPPVEITTTFARVALIGMSEGSDEWVDTVDATCVQPLDRMSGGKRWGGHSPRRDIVFLIHCRSRCKQGSCHCIFLL